MKYTYAFHTDVGIKKETNQDSFCIKEAVAENVPVFMIVICDGMGGLAKGEVASATVIKAFADWFDQEYAQALTAENPIEEVCYQWGRMIKRENQSIAEYGRNHHIQLGTTLSVMVTFPDGTYLVGHVGDTRIYQFTKNQMKILTTDQTVVANEVRQGRLTQEQAAQDPRRNVLLQCVGASNVVEPEFKRGTIMADMVFMFCSDGFRHVISQEELRNAFTPENSRDEAQMKQNIVNLIELNKQRGETDNITAVSVRIE